MRQLIQRTVKLKGLLQRFAEEEDAVGVVEIILILVGMCMRSKEKIAEEIVLVRYYNILFYLFFKTGMDDFKRQCLIKKIDDGESMRMKQIQDWCHCHQIPFKTKFTYRKDFSFRVNLWNLYSYCRFKIERQ